MLTTFREKMETECTRRVSQIEAKFQADCEEVTEHYEQSLQSLEGRYRQELKDLLDQHLDERAQWEFEKDELAQEVTDAQEQLKEARQREKATSLVLNQEREMLEKTYKERWTSLGMERDQLLQDLEDLRNTSESQHRLLSDQILELKRSQERELREQEPCQTGSFEQLASQQLERLQVEREQERREMLGKLAALESAHRMSRERADLEKAELSAEIHRLQNTVKDMQQATSLSVFQDAHSLGMAMEEAEGNGAMSLLQQGEQLLEENGDVLVSLQRAHEHAVKENAKMATEISRLQQRLKKLEPGSVMSSCLEEQMAEISGSSREQAEPFLSQIKQGESAAAKHILSDLREREAQDLGSTGTSSVRRQEGKSEASETSLECLSELGNSEDTRTESWDLKSQILQLQEQLTVLRADCDRASERKQDLLFDISVLKKKLKMLERVPEASSRYKLLYEDATRENACLQEELRLMETRYDESLDSNKELTTEVFRLQEEMKKMEEVTETFLSLEKSYDEVKMENEELGALVLRLQGKMEKLLEGAPLHYDSYPLWDTPSENLEVISDENVLELHQTPEARTAKVTSVRVVEECREETKCCEQGSAQLLARIKAHEVAWFHRTTQAHQEKPSVLNQVTLEESAALLGLQDNQLHHRVTIAELGLEKQKLQELTRKLRERVSTLIKQKDTPSPGEKEEELKAMMHDLQITCSEMQRKVELLR